MNIVAPAADEISDESASDEDEAEEEENYDDFDDVEEDFPMDFDLEAYDED